MTDKQKLKVLEKKLDHYKKIFIEKKKNFKGVKHESSLSELSYTEFMVYKNIVEGLEKEIKIFKSRYCASLTAKALLYPRKNF